MTHDDWLETDKQAMQSALKLAQQAFENDEVPVGAIVVKNNSIIGKGFNQSISFCDPTAHAEILALREACKSTGNYRLENATMYVTLEPCSMCIGAMLHARIQRMVFAAYDEKTGAAGSALDLVYERRSEHRLDVNGGLLAEQSSALLQKFFELRRSAEVTD